MAFLQTSSSGEILTVFFMESKILDAAMIQSMQEELLAILGRTEETNVLLDFRQVKFLSSAALGMLVRANKKCKEFKVTMKLCNLTPSIREVFKITGLDRALEIHPDTESAEKSFTKKGGFFRRV